MDQRTIERYERRRWASRLVNAALIPVYTVVLLRLLLGEEYFPGMGFGGKAVIWALAMAAVFLLAWYYDKYNKRILEDAGLSRALNSEMYRQNEYKACKAGFYGFVLASWIAFFTADLVEKLTQLPVKSLCVVVFAAGVFVYQIAWLIYNR